MKGALTCCGKGGSWFQKCGRNNDPKFEHTWGEGTKACAATNVPNDVVTPQKTISGSTCSAHLINQLVECVAKNERDCSAVICMMLDRLTAMPDSRFIFQITPK